MPPRTPSPFVPHSKLADRRRSKLPPMSPSTLRQRIANGEFLVIIDGLVVKLNGFIGKHPGGPLAIMHMVGRDATDEVLAMHPKEVIDEVMPRWAVATFVPAEKDGFKVSFVEDMELPYSAARSAVKEEDRTEDGLDYAAIQRDFRQLDQKLKDTGYYKCNYSDYVSDMARNLTFFAVAVSLILYGPHALWTYVVAGVSTALLWQQLAFFAHDLGHNELTGNSKFDMVLGVCIADLLGGLSVGWWKKNHNTHHIVTNDIDNDPDIQHMPFFAISTKFFESRYSTYYNRVMEFDAAARFFISMQDKLYYLIMCFARFNLYFLSWNYMLFSDFAPYRSLELGCIGVFLLWFSHLLSFIPTWPYLLTYIFISHSVSAILHIQITLSHFAMSTESPDPERECFAARQIRTTMDVICPTYFDWFHGGLQYQIEHHLFPRLPRHKLRTIQPMVKEICKRHGLDFLEFSFIDGNVYTMRWLGEIASQVKVYNCREKLESEKMSALKQAISAKN
ncbi:hypothetical protein FBU59_002602 [Linderina macrospora]|uniref:Uncharacterized protein n=1 Tax=Linderina macrospora TaxID=4868 RepID=A0ACC1JAZ3_9FUNG|nr:hypothetical protein FBU59_002602 [Linderina macrospora]